jgi:Fe-S cluster assembly scaffold protein SufB
VIAEKGAEVAIVEEHFGIGEEGGGCYWANPVVDIVVEEGARVVHSYVQRQSAAAAHTKWTTVQQVRLSCAFILFYCVVVELWLRYIIVCPFS